MITIDLLKKHPASIPRCAEIWHEVLGKIWMPEIGIEEIESLYSFPQFLTLTGQKIMHQAAF